MDSLRGVLPEDSLRFFFLIFLDEKIALRLTQKCLSQVKKSLSKKNIDLDEKSLFVRHSSEQVTQAMKKKKTFSTGLVLQGGILIPKDLDLGMWRQFQKEGMGDEVITLLWMYCLGLSAETVARGLHVSVGTVNTRVSRGLRALSHSLIPLRIKHS